MLALTIFGTLVLYSAACLGFGSAVLNALKPNQGWDDRPSSGTLLATAFLLGQGFLANLWQLLALGGWLSPIVVTVIVTMLATLAFPITRRSLIDFLRQLQAITDELRRESWGWRLLALLTLGLGLGWVTSLGRPLSMDGGAFYMALPKVVAATHHLKPLTGIFDEWTSIGLQGEMHHAALMSLGNADAARMFGWPTALAGAIVLLALGRRAGLGRRGQWIATTMLFSSSAVILLSGFGKTDLYATSLGLAAYFWAAELKSNQNPASFWLAGIFCGLAIVAKFSFLAAILPGILIIIIWTQWGEIWPVSRLRTGWSRNLKHGYLVMAGIAIAALPHLIKNAVLFDNPIAPFGPGVQDWLSPVWYGQDIIRRILLSYPLAITYGSYYAQLGNLSPLVLAFMPLVLLLPRPKVLSSSLLTTISLAALAGIFAWTLVRPAMFAPRYILSSLLLLILPAARAAEFVTKNEGKPRWMSAGIMTSIGVTILAVGLASSTTAFFPEKTYEYLSGKITECGRDGNTCKVMVFFNREVAAGTRLFINSHQRYWLRPDLIQCLATSDEIDSYLAIHSDEARWEFLYERGFRYLVDFDDPGFVLEYIPLPVLESAPEWLRIIYSRYDAYAIVELQSLDSNRRADVVCRMQDTGEWELVPLFFSHSDLH